MLLSNHVHVEIEIAQYELFSLYCVTFGGALLGKNHKKSCPRSFSIIWFQSTVTGGVVEFINASAIFVEWHQVLNVLTANDGAWCYMLRANPFCVHIHLFHVSWLTDT